jgi:hypothetical protein
VTTLVEARRIFGECFGSIRLQEEAMRKHSPAVLAITALALAACAAMAQAQVRYYGPTEQRT